MAARAYIGGRDPIAPQRATGPCRPLGVGATGPFFSLQGPRCEFEEKKLHLRPVALCGLLGVFLKYFKTDIYF